ncbi:MAG TPA: SpoIID/LytB domain-containing protein [Methylomirabilota bacterium]|nr:SpoIID/LytB domain-containing protein [Methylomirabilota bacterium]
MIAALLIGTLGVWLAATPAWASGDIRVALAEGLRTVELGGGPLVLQDLQGRRLTRVSPTWIRVMEHGSGVEVRGVGRVPARLTGVRVAVGGGAVRVKSVDYPGTVEVRRGAEGLLVINALPLEDYVVGSVKAEAGEAMPLEMLKAQAIVARTYAAYHRRLNAGKPYEIVAATAHQQYAGRVGPDSPIWTAVRETRGQVLLWEGDLFPAFYHTDSGGHTEDPRVVFAASNMPALRPVRVEFPSDSPHHLWTLDVPLVDLSAALQRAGVGVGRVSGLEVLERSVSLRATRILVTGTGGRVALRGNDLRRVIGYDTLKSTLFAVAVDDTIARFAGRGYGHGVGLDQAGAKTMGQLGYTARQILTYYYPGAEFGSLQ